VTLIFALLVLAAGIVWLARRPSTPATDADARDPELLDDAEAEVRSLDAMASPEDAADRLPDWGPGVPDRGNNPPGR
jgi:hypothetical protein